MHDIKTRPKSKVATCSCGHETKGYNYINRMLWHIKPQGGYANLFLVLLLLVFMASLSITLAYYGIGVV